MQTTGKMLTSSVLEPSITEKKHCKLKYALDERLVDWEESSLCEKRRSQVIYPFPTLDK